MCEWVNKKNIKGFEYLNRPEGTIKMNVLYKYDDILKIKSDIKYNASRANET